MQSPKRPARRWLRHLLAAVILVFAAVGAYGVYRPLPEGLSIDGAYRTVSDVAFLADLTYIDPNGRRQTEQAIFDEAFALINGARRFVLVDMFLYNAFQGEQPETHRALSAELTERLIRQKARFPDMQILVITDPFNTLYGGVPSPHLAALERAGISVTLTRLTALPDSNPLYSAVWRAAIQWFGNSAGSALPNPVGPGRVSVRSYLALFNFKANHRKVLIADSGTDFVGLVTSANPHDGSSAHGNVALRFSGPAVADLLATERAVLAFSGGPLPAVDIPRDAGDGALRLRILTERAIERAALDALAQAGAGDAVDLAMFYLSDRHIIDALLGAHQRGARLRIVLDPNKDAFGRTKNGVPNRPVAHELHQAGIPVRWCDTHGEQCHSKLLRVRLEDGTTRLILGSANYTRRNLDDLNLETNVELVGPADAGPLREAGAWFDLRWSNTAQRRFSVDYPQYADESLWHRVLYRVMEASGLSTF